MIKVGFVMVMETVLLKMFVNVLTLHTQEIHATITNVMESTQLPLIRSFVGEGNAKMLTLATVGKGIQV